MPSNSKPPLVRRGFVIVLSLTLLSGYVGFTAMQRARRPIRSTKSTQVLQDLRMIDAAIDQYAIESNKSGGATVGWKDVHDYLKTRTRSELPEQATWNVTQPEPKPDEVDSLVHLLTLHPSPEVRGFIEKTVRPVLASTSKSTILLSQDDMRAIERSELFQRITNPAKGSDELTRILNNPPVVPAPVTPQSPSK